MLKQQSLAKEETPPYGGVSSLIYGFRRRWARGLPYRCFFLTFSPKTVSQSCFMEIGVQPCSAQMS